MDFLVAYPQLLHFAVDRLAIGLELAAELVQLRLIFLDVLVLNLAGVAVGLSLGLGQAGVLFLKRLLQPRDFSLEAGRFCLGQAGRGRLGILLAPGTLLGLQKLLQPVAFRA